MSNEKLVKKILRTLPKKFIHKSNKKKRIALKASLEDVDDEDFVETMNLVAKNFNKPFKRFNKKPYGGTNNPRVNDKGNNRWKKAVKQDNFNMGQQDRGKRDSL
ncbi:hypothetical protein LIER_19439 [Lithospermum erythrorhizon]|uniref:Uncharacterized protein n=1 Tax=Lithospermum erythrorhizon TaxID=34254 RepID=A0AAV3QKC1_LITER